jgi:hypothetical protein
MKRFLIQLFVLIGLVLVLYYTLLRQADGYIDPNYQRFTSSKQNSLILGTSKAAQGVQPKVINEILGSELYNYSFSIGASPFGPVYLKSIKKKIKDNSHDGIFIVTVDPWSISSRRTPINNINNFRENNNMLGSLPMVSLNPNVFYLNRFYTGQYKDVLEPSQNWFYLHDDGWLEVFSDIDSTSIAESRARVLENWLIDSQGKYKFSYVRLEYLKRTIEFLNTKGEVYIVRLPIDKELLKAENSFMPDFNDKINRLEPLVLGYLDMNQLDHSFIFPDGVHMHSSSGKEASEIIANWILKLSRNKTKPLKNK